VRRALFDTNVVLDVLLNREPHFAASAAALDGVARGAVEGYVAGHAVTTVAYLLQRQLGAAGSRAALADLLSQLRVAPVTDAVVRRALASPLRDFEDAVCDAAAGEAGAEVIVTRNVTDFGGSGVAAVLPEVFLARLRSRGEDA
jgi:predicted nucleic acid-binding protein